HATSMTIANALLRLSIQPPRFQFSMIRPKVECDSSIAWRRGELRAKAKAATRTKGVVGTSGNTTPAMPKAVLKRPTKIHKTRMSLNSKARDAVHSEIRERSRRIDLPATCGMLKHFRCSIGPCYEAKQKRDELASIRLAEFCAQGVFEGEEPLPRLLNHRLAPFGQCQLDPTAVVVRHAARNQAPVLKRARKLGHVRPL